ncbi:hypothetical protein Sros01_54490 [Streptomyces roseochromogenus]|nr:hypothetical protein Sros01_54490 [Streptomyces roseochromogenus]
MRTYTPQATRARVESVKAISTRPAITTAGNIPVCSQPRISGLASVSTPGAAGEAATAAASEVMSDMLPTGP